MNKGSKRFCSGLPRRVGAIALSAAMISGSLYTDYLSVSAAGTSWKTDVETALQDLLDAESGADNYAEAETALKEAYDSLEGSQTVEDLVITGVDENSIVLEWSKFEADSLVGYNVYWSDSNTETSQFQLLDKDSNNVFDESAVTISADSLDSNAATITFKVQMPTFKHLWFKVAPVTAVGAGSKTEAVMAPTTIEYQQQLEKLGRGLTATMTASGVYLNWRLLSEEVSGYGEKGLTGVNFNVYRDNEKIATVTDSTNYLDTANTTNLTASTYKLVPVDAAGAEIADKACTTYDIFTADGTNANVAYKDIPLQKPADTTIKETYGVDSIALGGYTWTDAGYGSADDVITYNANDMSVADVDGDGEYEYLVKWDPSRAKDVSQQGYTGKAYIDCYELDGTILWRLDLGINIRAGAHYTEFGAFDYDGDGKAELMVKTAPGTKMIQYQIGSDGKNVMENGAPKVASEKYVTISDKDKAAGVTDSSDYVFSAAEYRDYLIEIFQDWGKWSKYSEKTVADAIEGHWSNNLVTMFSVSDKWRDTSFYTGEVVGGGNQTISMTSITADQIKQYIPEYQEGDTLVNVCLRDSNGDIQHVGSTGSNPVMKTVRVQDVANYTGNYNLASCNFDASGKGYTKEQATILADYFLQHYQYRMRKHNLNTYEGYVITGPEYISLFDCSNGAELDTQDWFYAREDDGMLWGDYAMDFMEPGNRCDRFNVAIAYLDGETPSCVMGRGYYTRTTMAAYNVVDKKLKLIGSIDSGWTVMTNPFNDGPHGYDGCDPVNGTLSGQGDHYIAVADIDYDGRHDIINGGAIVSYKDGELYLYSSGGDYLGGGDPTRQWAKYGHGDAIHITDINPDHPGLEIASCFEGAAWAPYNWAVRDARSNKVLFGAPGTEDHGRTMIGDVLTNVRGLESTEGFDANGKQVSLTGTSTNMNIKWSANMSTQFVDGSRQANVVIIGNVDGKKVTFLNAAGYRSNNDAKGNPCLVADIFGDYREEMILRSEDSSHVRIFMNTESSEYKNYTLMHNTQYRANVASQNSSYNQPAYTDYYYASDTDWSLVSVPNRKADQNPGDITVNPSSVVLNMATATIFEGSTLQLAATVSPAAADQTITWSVDDSSIATVDTNGLVTAVKAGTVTVTATTINGLTSTCRISVSKKYQEDGLDKMKIGDSYTFNFGTSATSSDNNRAVKADTVYSKENGYGWQAAQNITLTDGADYVAGTNYRTTANNITTWEYPTFVADVPNGIYEVKIVQGTNGTDRAVNGAYVEGNMYSVRWSSEGFATSYAEPSEGSWIWTEAGQTKESTVTTAVADGQLTINLATSLKDDGTSGTTYIKQIVVTRKEQITENSEQPTLRFIGDSTLAKYPPEDGGEWTPIPERTGWGEDFSMGKFVDESVQLVNKAVAGSSLKSYIYDGYYNDFFLNSHPGDTVIIEGGINDSAAGRRYSNADEFETGLRYLIDSCKAFGLDVILSSGTSSGTDYTARMSKLAEEYSLPYVDLLGLWGNYLGKMAIKDNLTVDGTHLKRVGGIVAAQLVANEIADLEGLYISGHVKKIPVNDKKPTVSVAGVYPKAQTENSLTLAWSIPESNLYQPDQLITGFNVYRKEKGSSAAAEVIATQTAYVSAGMNGPQLFTTIEAPTQGSYTYYVTCQGVMGEGPASASIDVDAFVPDARYTLTSLVEQYQTQMYDASPYKVESYAAVKVALAAGEAVLENPQATEDEIKAALDKVQTAINALELNATEFIKDDFQKEELKTAPWGVTGSHSGLMSCIMDTDGNRMLRLYVEASGGRNVGKTFADADTVNAAVEMVEFEWYPGKPDVRNCTEVEFYSTSANRVLSLKSSNNGHIGYVVGNYPADNRYLIGDGFHQYEGSTAVDLGLTNEAWYNVKLVFNFDDSTADLYIVPRDDASLESKEVKGIKIDAAGSKTITAMNFLLKRGRTDGDAGNDLSILWDSRFDDYAIYHAAAKNTVDKTAYNTALTAYQDAIKGLNSSVLADEKFVLADTVIDIMTKDVGFFNAADYAYAVNVLNTAKDAAPKVVNTTSVKVTADNNSVTAGMTKALTAELSAGANEDLVWTSSDETIATVEGKGTSAVVNAVKTGNVTITATGVNSKVAGSIELTVTGEVYYFGKDVTADSVYSKEKGYGFMDYTYPTAAKGWKNDIYYARELVQNPGASYIVGSEPTKDYLAINGQVWAENEGGRDEDAIVYENTNAFVIDKRNGNFIVGVTFYNPTNTAMKVMVKAEDIRRYDAGDHETSQLAEATIGAGQTVTVDFELALTDKQLTLRFEQNEVAGSYETAGARTVYVKSVSLERTTHAINMNPKPADKEFKFTDVSTDSSNWMYPGINYVFQRNIMNGKSATTFDPTGKLTRAEFVTTLYAMEGKPDVVYQDKFSDVKEGEWWTNPIMWANENGVTAGIGNGKFGVAGNITREQLVLMVYKFAQLKNVEITTEEGKIDSFKDADKVSGWAKEAMDWAITNGVISGKGATLDPAGNATRAECAAILRTFHKNFIGDGDSDYDDYDGKDNYSDDSDKGKKPTIYTIGDSTVQTYTRANYRNGWAQVLHTIFGTLVEDTKQETDTGYAFYETEDTYIKNYARDARSAKSFRQEGRLNEVLLGLKKGDYVFLQFAHNDDNAARPNRFLSVEDYKKYLKQYNDAIIERGSTLVLVTPIVLNVWEADGSLDHRFDDYRLAMMQVAAENKIPVLDLMGSSLELVTKMGADNVNKVGMYMSDTVHTQPAGAAMYAKLLGNLLNASTDSKLTDLKSLLNVTSNGNISIECDEVLDKGDKKDITVKAGVSSDKVSLYSSDENVVKIQDGKLVAVGKGQAIITAGYVSGDAATTDCTAYTAYKVITVSEMLITNTILETVKIAMPVLNAEAEPIKVQTLNAPSILTDGETVGNVTVYTDATVPGKQASPLAGYLFDFGTKSGTAESFTGITNQTYSAEAGYGFTSDVAGINSGSHSDGSVVANGSDAYDMALSGAVSDACRANEMEFAIDIPAGEYQVDIYSYDTWNNGWSDGATFFINGIQVGTKTQAKEEVQTVAQNAMSARIVAAEDSQIVVRAEAKAFGTEGVRLAFLSAITINEYVEKVDPFNAEAWEKANSAINTLLRKTATFKADSTPFDYDVSLVNKMVAAKDALADVAYMRLADTTTGDEVYALAEEAVANNTLYTETSIAKLQEAMEAYNAVKANLSVSDKVAAAREVLEYWLDGVKTDYETQPFEASYDFNTTQTGGNKYDDSLGWEAAGWTPVGVVDGHPSLDMYSAEKGYGLLANITGTSRNRGNADLMMADWASGVEFAVDLPAGTYNVTTFSGDLNPNCKAPSEYKFYTDYTNGAGTELASLAKETAPDAGSLTRSVSFTLTEAKQVVMVSPGYVNGVIFEQIIPAEVQQFDIAELAGLVEQIDAAAPVETDYTISTWTAFKTAYDEAKKAVENGASFAQQIKTIYTDLEDSYKALQERTATSEYALDFGPEKESDTVAAQVWGNAPLLKSEGGVEMTHATPELGLGTMLYDTNTDDNGMHYGFTEEVNSGFTATGGAYFRDWVYGIGGKAYTFKADVPVGKYKVYVYTGCKEAANTSRFYFNNGEAAIESSNEAVEVVDGKTVYTQVSNSGGQFVSPGCIYTVEVKASDDVKSVIKGATLGTFSLTVFNDDAQLTSEEVTARLCGIELCRIGDLDAVTANVTDELLNTITEAEELDEEVYTEESFLAVQDALKAAKEVAANEMATQMEIDNAAADLAEAVEALQVKEVQQTESAVESSAETVNAEETVDSEVVVPETEETVVSEAA